MKNELNLGFLLIGFIFLSSCVGIDKYNELVQVKDYLEAENQRLTNQEGENRDLLAEKRKLTLDLENSQAKLREMEASIQSINRNYQDLANRYNALIADNRNIGSGSANQKQFWEEEIAKKQLELENTQREVQTLRYAVNQKEKRIQELLQLLRAKEGN